MKRKITLSIAFSVLLLSVIMSDSTVKVAAARTYVADTGMITLGPNQFLRMTAANPQRSRVTSLTVTFTAQVTSSTCSNGVCTHTVTTETTTSPVTLATGQAASHDIMPTPGASAVRALVIGNSPDMLVNALIIDSTTGNVIYISSSGGG